MSALFIDILVNQHVISRRQPSQYYNSNYENYY
jgi:hypothetical protein